MRKLWLITTEHLKAGLWFRDEEDYKVGMNFVALQAHASRVVVLSFTLMSNHVHFVVKADTKRDAEAFIEGFKHRYSLYLRRKYGVKEFLRGNGVRIDLISPYDEDPEKAIAYVEMNCVAANICLNPADYPWGTGNCFFRATSDKGRALGSLSVRARNKLMHSKLDLPPGWIVGEGGYILPGSFVNVAFVEDLYRNPKNMDYYLRNSSKAKQRLARGEEGLPSFRDQIILAAIPDLCQTLFHKWRINELDENQQAKLVSQIRRRFSADVNQIARVTGIPYPDVARMLESF